MSFTEKLSLVEKTIKNLEKIFGQGAVMILGDDNYQKVESISTGSLSLDMAMSIGGYPMGRIVEIFGHESSGKTTLALHGLAEVQKKGGTVAFIDAEHALDIKYATSIGLNCNEMLLSQPDSGEQALQIAETLIKDAEIKMIVIDSVAALIPIAELKGEIGDQHIGLQARLMSQALRRLSGVAYKQGSTVIFINQIRNKIGGYGMSETTTGGNALKFYSSLRLDVRKTNVIKQGEDSIGIRVGVKVVKNKLAPPFKFAEFDLIYGKGIDFYGELLDLGIQMNLINKNGSWYYIEDKRLGQGREGAKEWLSQNLSESNILLEKIKGKDKINSLKDEQEIQPIMQ